MDAQSTLVLILTVRQEKINENDILWRAPEWPEKEGEREKGRERERKKGIERERERERREKFFNVTSKITGLKGFYKKNRRQREEMISGGIPF